MKRWNILSEYTGNIEDLVPFLLKTRGFDTIQKIEEFLNPPLIKDYYVNFSIEFKEALKNARILITDCIKKNVPIIIYGDYDSDGVNATTIIYSTIKDELNYQNIKYFIPNRFRHGYGLSKKALDEILADYNGKQVLFITVDTGITGTDEIEYLKSLGHYIVLTDHHQKPENVPQPDVLVWNEEIVGTMVSWFLAKALGSKNNKSISMGAIATVTDLFPMLGVNRSIVKTGLEILNSEESPLGIKNLLQVSKKKGEVTTYDLGWVIGPRLNAAGRLEDANLALELLLEKDNEKSFDLAKRLNEVNVTRQDKTLEMYDLIEVNEKELPKVLVVANEKYHDGIIGLVASKLVQKYYRPSIVISLEDGFGKGSVRSVAGVNIIEMLRKFEDLFVDIGGHPMAAGFTIKRENIDILRDKLTEYANEVIPDELLVPELKIDLAISLDLITLDLLNEIDRLKPFGLGNEQPIFVSKNLQIADISKIGKDASHLSLRLSSGKGLHKAIWFGGAEQGASLNLGDTVDVVYSLNRNEYNGKTYIDLVVKDLK